MRPTEVEPPTDPGQLPQRTVSLRYVPRFDRHRCDVTGVGHEHRADPAAYHWDNAARSPGCLLQVTLAGAGRFRDYANPDRPVERALPVGRALLVEMPSPTAYYLATGETWRFLWCMLTGELAQYHVRRLVREHGNVLPLPPASAPVQMLADLYLTVLRDPSPDERRLSAGAYQLLMELDHALAHPSTGVPDTIEWAQRYIDAHLHEPELDVARLADEAGYSRYHFSRLFKQHTRLSPHRYLLRMRIRRALALLASSDEPVKRISLAVGFKDPSHFGAAFRRHVGQSPEAVRREQQQLGAADTRTV